jgi:hypothetical protein
MSPLPPPPPPNPAPESPWQQWFEGIWADREERLYREFFGDLGEGIYTIPPSVFEAIGWKDPDARFLTHGVFACPPTDRRPHWLYVTSGMSNPWGDTPETANPQGYSGLGYEFTLHAPEKSQWPIRILHWLMAVQLAVATGNLQGELLQRNDRIPLGGTIGRKDGVLTHLLVTGPDAVGNGPLSPHLAGYPAQFGLASGQVELLLMIGMSAREADFAKTQGPEALLTLLHHRGVFPLTDPARPSLV